MKYRKEMPPFLREAAQAPALLRLQDIGMHCGCQYTSLPVFRGLAPYSRFCHSLGVARILWDFTEAPAQALSGLFHDAATPVFSHVVDFLNGDHLTQESTEAGLDAIIKKDTALMAVLDDLGLSPEETTDCARYPLADCPSPRLCADRLEYTLSNGVHYGFAADVQPMYDDLAVGENEAGQPELVFTTPETALSFARMALSCGKIYVCDEDRYAMERLSRLLQEALDARILTRQDLHTREAAVIEKLLASPLRQDYLAFRRLHKVTRVDGPGAFTYRVPAKKRYINPLVRGQGRVTELFPEFREQVRDFLSQSQEHYLRGE